MLKNYVLLRNEHESNLFVAKMMVVAFFMTFIVITLTLLGLLGDMKDVRMQASFHGEIATAVLFLIPIIVILVLKIEKNWVKYMVVTITAFAIMINSYYSTAYSERFIGITILWLFIVGIACLYFSLPLTWYAIILTLIFMSGINYISASTQNNFTKIPWYTLLLINLIQVAPISLVSVALTQKAQKMVHKLVLIEENQAVTIEALKKIQDELIQAEKMVTIGRLVAGITHELSTPMGVSLLASSHLQESTKRILTEFENKTMKRTDLEKFLGTALESTTISVSNLQKASDLVSSFKRVAADQASEEKRVFQVRDYIEKIYISLKPKFKSTQHKVNIECDEKISILSCPGALYQILTNFINNSLMHGFEKDFEGVIYIKFTLENQDAVLQYRDNGKGISKDNITKIYDEFFTTNADGGGTGLGMNIVKEIVSHQLNGSITCESELGKGVLFTISFPV